MELLDGVFLSDMPGDDFDFFKNIIEVFGAVFFIWPADDDIAGAKITHRTAKRDMNINRKGFVRLAEFREFLLVDPAVDVGRPFRGRRITGVTRAGDIKFLYSFLIDHERTHG